MANAVFLPQGNLDSLLFGTNTEREELFVKLVNMSYCQRRSEVLALKSKQMKSGIQDVSVALEEIQDNIDHLLGEMVSISSEVQHNPDYSEIIKNLRDKKTLTSNVDVKRQYLTEEQANCTLLSEQIANAEQGLKLMVKESSSESEVEFEEFFKQQKTS